MKRSSCFESASSCACARLRSAAAAWAANWYGAGSSCRSGVPAATRLPSSRMMRDTWPLTSLATAVWLSASTVPTAWTSVGTSSARTWTVSMTAPCGPAFSSPPPQPARSGAASASALAERSVLRRAN